MIATKKSGLSYMVSTSKLGKKFRIRHGISFIIHVETLLNLEEWGFRQKG